MEKWWSFGIRAGIGIGDQVWVSKRKKLLLLEGNGFLQTSFRKFNEEFYYEPWWFVYSRKRVVFLGETHSYVKYSRLRHNCSFDLYIFY